MERSFKNLLSILLACGVTSMAHADKLLSPAPGQMEAIDNSSLLDRARATAPARTITHQVMAAPTTNLKAVRVDTNESISNDHYLMGVEPSTVMAAHPETIPHRSTDASNSPTDVPLGCFSKSSHQFPPSPVGIINMDPSTSPDDYDVLCNQVSPCQDNLCDGRKLQ